mgnify:CR=1 FL=1
MPTLTVKGMSCNHCKQAVTQALEALPGVSDERRPRKGRSHLEGIPAPRHRGSEEGHQQTGL